MRSGGRVGMFVFRFSVFRFSVFVVEVGVRDGDGGGGGGADVLSLCFSLFSSLFPLNALSLHSIRGSYVVNSSRCVAPLRIASCRVVSRS
jgi:hypothetical protein